MNEMSIKEIIDLIQNMAEEKGWGTKPEHVNFAEKIALTHSELSEALNAYRKGNHAGKDGVNEELADALIRLLHLCGIYNIDICSEVVKKMDLNRQRSWEADNLRKQTP